MPSLRRLLTIGVMTSCFATSGCGLTLGPKVGTEYVILHPGLPMQVLENSKMKGRTLDGTGDAVQQEVGGWIMMPPSHWEAIKRNLEKK